jgi:hypothetical protein
MFLQPGGGGAAGYVVSLAADNAINRLITIIVSCSIPGVENPETESITAYPDLVTSTINWKFPSGAREF